MTAQSLTQRTEKLMSHDIWEEDNFLTVRKPGWHGLGVVLDEYPTRAEAQAIAHPWEPISEPVYLQDVVVEFDEWAGESKPYELYEEAPGFKAIRRSDSASLLGIVGEGYEPVTNNEMWDIAEALQGEASDVMFETAGSLQGGRKVWILVRLKDPIAINGDPNGATLPYFSLQNAHNGSGAFRGQATMTRIVCANTAQVADQEARARGTEFAFRHTLNVRDRIEEARMALGGWRESIEDWVQLSEHMLDVHLELEDVETFLERWIPMPPSGTATERVITNVEEARGQWWSAYNSVTCEGIRGTAQGVFAASTEYAEHYRRAHNKESAFKRAYLDSSQAVKSAQKLVMELAR